MNRAGLVNFWYYDHEIFHFQDGKLLLRGTNGSGKSVTMQSFLPVLLDGKKSPDRLDPFGSKARRMEDYLLGEKEVVDRDERTGYLFIEYKKAGTEQYITTGIGMQAKRNKGIKSWYFIVTDNRRIGLDFHLTGKHAGEEVPFSAKELENRLGQGGYVVHSQREYMELVNRYVFGFQNIDAYEDLIKLLIQLRSPKLSKDFKPTVIYEILESALPPLTDDELRHLSETIENMDQTAQQLEQLEREHDSMERLVTTYDHYNKYMMAERAQGFMESEQKRKKAEKSLQDLKEQFEEYSKKIVQLTEDLQYFQQQKSVAEEEKSSLQTHEVWFLEEDKGKKEAEAKALLKEIEQLQRKWQERNTKLSSKWKEKENAELEMHNNEQQVKELLEELALDAEEAAFHGHQVNMADYERMKDHSFTFSTWLKEAREHQELLVQLEKLAEDVNRKEEEYVRLQQESSEKKKVVDVHQKELDHLQQWFETEQQELESKVFQWMEGLPKLHYSPQHRQEIARGIQGLYEKNRFDPVMDKLLSEIHSHGAEVKKDLAITKEMRQKKLEEIGETEAELNRIKTQKMLEPERASGTDEHRDKLRAANIPFVPFYAAVEFQEHVTEAQRERIESALKKVGILDSLLTTGALTPEQDSVLLPEPQLLGYTLADFLIPDIEEDSPITKELVDEVLRSISLEKDANGFSIDADGTYSIGCLIGHAPMEGKSKFIGRTSRKRHQREQILLWTEKLKAQEEELSNLEGDIQRLEEEFQQVEAWKQTIPHDGELRELHEQIVAKRQELKGEQELLRRIDEQWKMVHEKLTIVKRELRERGLHLNITLTHEDIKCALKAAGSYLNFLHQFTSVALNKI